MRRTSLAIVCAGLTAGAGTSTASAAAEPAADAFKRPRVVTVCATRTALYETPGGARVAILYRGDRVRVRAFGADDGWWRVTAGFGTRGWLRASATCKPRR